MTITLTNIFFLAVIFILFYSAKKDISKIRILLYGSLAFYVYYEALFTPLLVAISLLAFAAAHFIEKYRDHKKIILGTFLFAILMFYFPLKYNSTFEDLLDNVFKTNNLRWFYLPLGLSFYAFKTMSYVFDVYYERSAPQKSIEKFLLYVSFFPQILCGPIMGADEFFNQLEFKNKYDREEILEGMRLIALGTFKKMVLANNLFLIIQDAFINPWNVAAIEWVLVSIVTRFYIYFDFGGYSDISNGVSMLFGVKVQKNFDQPFRSKSITEFWRRWHISLSNWIRDYVYFPMVSAFSSYAGIYIGLVLSFIVLGLWHGDQLNYVLYGLVNGIAVACSTWYAKKQRSKVPPHVAMVVASRIFLYLFLIFLPSLLLMSHDAETLYRIVSSLEMDKAWTTLTYFPKKSFLPLVIVVAQIAIMFELFVVFYGKELKEKFHSTPVYMRIMYIGLSILITYSLLSPEVNYRFLYQEF